VPPRRDRIEDLPLLVEHLLARLEVSTGLGPLRIADSALLRLAAHPWPGNVRELEAALARALVRAESGRIEADHLQLASDPPTVSAEGGRNGDVERALLSAALLENEGNLTRAALRIGWSRAKLYRRMVALGVPRPERPAPRPQSSSDAGAPTTSSDSSTFQ
jgi:DNA-binding NtrC family response regulator